MRNPIKGILSSNLVWRLTGLTYPTAVIATTGSYLSKTRYVNTGREEMKIFFSYLNKNKTILEFGCGPGRNLFGIANLIKMGYGIDINALYIRLAEKLAKKYNFNNLKFLKYDGFNFPDIPKVDLVYEKGVFERINKILVKSYIERLRSYLNENGIMILYFLMEKARATEFTSKLGDQAYFFWRHDEIQQMLKDASLKIKEVIVGKYSDFYVCETA
jgi:cyclopropane fatty-acyl-phospholipid synthase-like methyltransferase